MATLTPDPRLDALLYRVLGGDASPGAAWVRYALAALLSAFALTARLVALPPEADYALVAFYPAVLLAAFMFGAGPGLLTVVLGAACYFLVVPAGAARFGFADILLLGFCLYGLLMCSVARVTHAALLDMRTSEQKFRALFTLSGLGFMRTDSSYGFLECNPAFERITGYTTAELRDLDVWMLTAPEDRELSKAQAELIARTGRFGPYEKFYVRKDGSRVPIQLQGMTVVTPTGEPFVWSVVEDISARRQAAADRARGEEQLHRVFESMAEGIVVQDAEARVIDANRAAERVLGLTRDQLLGRTSLDPAWRAVRVDGTPFPGEEHPAPVSLRTGQPVHGQLMGLPMAGQQTRWISINAEPMFEGGATAPTGVVATFSDITRQVHLTAELREARADLQAILDHVPARISSWDAQLMNRFMNRQGRALFSRSEDTQAGDALGRHASEILGMERYLASRAQIDAALGGAYASHELQDRYPDGRIRYSKVDYVPQLSDGRVVGLYVLGADITEIRSLLVRLRELAQRLESVREDERRQIAQGLHEGLAQDLFALRLGMGQLRDLVPQPPVVVEAFGELEVLIDKCIADTRQIANDLQPAALAFARVAVVIGKHAQYFAALAKLDIGVREEPGFPVLPEPVCLLLFRAAQEALTNVARHAAATRVEITLLAPPGQIVMSVVDDGTGIDEAALAKAGSLGLLGIRERFARFDGTLSVQRFEPHGTELRVTLPATAGAPLLYKGIDE